MTNFSVVMPIHNEQSLLQQSLPSVYALDPSEVLLLFDRCTDHSKLVAQTISQDYDAEAATQLIEMNMPCDWQNRIAYLTRWGFQQAKNDTILFTAADLILDPQITSLLYLNHTVKLIVFDCLDYPFTYRSLLLYVIGQTPLNSFYRNYRGPIALSKNAWQETEDLESLCHIRFGEDTHLQQAITTKYVAKTVTTKTIHLRNSENPHRHYEKGRAYRRVAHRPSWIVLLSAMLLLRPKQAVGYLHARHD